MFITEANISYISTLSMADINQLLMEEAAPEDQDIMEGIMASLDDVLMPKNNVSNVMVDLSPLQPQLQKNKECKCLVAK